jgi:predicted TIM-barrel fold metal-dependent hydrolase
MIVDFQHHYTPAALLERDLSGSGIRLDENGNPDYRLNPLLSDLPAHLRMMDRAGIDAAVLSCGLGFDQPDLAICRSINNGIRQAELDYPGRFMGLAHVPALDSPAAADELRRCAAEFGFPGAVIASEIQGRMLDDDALRPFWRAAAALDLYVFIHPLPKVIAWRAMDADDLGRMLGWEFSLIVAAVRLVNCGLLDELPALRIQLAHFGGGIGRYLPRIAGMQQRENWGTDALVRHGRRPRQVFEHYLRDRFFYDCAGWTGPDQAARRGLDWITSGLSEVPASRTVFATDYPQAVESADEVKAYVDMLRGFSPDTRAVLDGGQAAAQLIPDLRERLRFAMPQHRS